MLGAARRAVNARREGGVTPDASLPRIRPMNTPRASLWIVLATLVLLAAGLYAAWRAARPPGLPPASAPDARAERVPDDTTDGAVDLALGQIPPAVDSTEIKTGWRDDVAGIDLGALTPAQRELMLRYANSEGCTCGCGFTLAACRTYDLTCPVSLPRVEALRDSITSGRITSADGLRTRPTRSG
jgi:hypothetical protein